jgi:hypothetical protein
MALTQTKHQKNLQVPKEECIPDISRLDSEENSPAGLSSFSLCR